MLDERLQAARADWDAGVVRVVRGGKGLLNTRHHLDAARLTEEQWRRRWQAGRRFLQADGESGKRFGNETVRVTPGGEVSLRLPAPLAHLANAPHGRYVLTARVGFAHRGEQWADRVTANRAVAYRIHEDTGRGRWYLTASWTIPPTPAVPLEAARAQGLVGVDTNADHLAAWRLDAHGNPLGAPRRFDYDLTGTAHHRDAQIRHALIRLLLPHARLRSRGRYPHGQTPRLGDRGGGPRLRRGEDPQDHTPSCGSGGDRKTRPGTPGPATDDTAPCSPER
ncbi:hypothetical protein STRIP9103_06863 [Streptomyces ipomoeae 91-03]|uniref:Transposase n=1 Tax=Streptomyces ipomoeae 91-03 TaxID=698759 RepID=L1KZS6_9ACTN|nr:hypothetical protein STRIP9103_06863 [Streptomyces ipomoeae 91-03]